MGDRTRIEQDRQVAESRAYVDTLAPGASLQSTAEDAEDDLNALRSIARRIKRGAAAGRAWYDDQLDAGGISRGLDHALLDTLLAVGPAAGHSGAFLEVLPSGSPFPTSRTWWSSAAKTVRRVDQTITRDAQQKPTSIVWKIYDAAGAVLLTVTDTIAYSGPFTSTRTRTIA